MVNLLAVGYVVLVNAFLEPCYWNNIQCAIADLVGISICVIAARGMITIAKKVIAKVRSK